MVPSKSSFPAKSVYSLWNRDWHISLDKEKILFYHTAEVSFALDREVVRKHLSFPKHHFHNVTVKVNRNDYRRFKVEPADLEKIQAWLPPEKLSDWQESMRLHGAAMVGLGALHFLMPFLNSYFGVVLILFGIITIVSPRKNTLLINSILLVVAGIWNLVVGFNSGWVLLALLQFYWGYKDYQQYVGFDERFLVKAKAR